MKGFVFSIDALFALMVCSAILLSVNSVTSGFGARHASSNPGSDILSCLEEAGSLQSVDEAGLASMLSPFNRCGKLAVEWGGAGARTVSTCECSDEVEVSVRSFISYEDGGLVFGIARLEICQVVSP